VVAIPFGFNAYRRNVGQFSETRLVNQYGEIGSDKSFRLIGRPGLVQAYSLAAGPVYGLYAQPGSFNGDLFAVAGGSLYRNGSSVGSLSSPGRVSMASSELQLLVATGYAMYVYDGSTISTVAFPDGAGENSVVYFAGLFICARTGSEKFYWSAVLDGSSWNALSFASAERKPDNLVGIAVVGDELWLFGENSTEFWVSTGNADAPFERAEGRVYDKGAISRDSICNYDNTAAWVGQDKIVYRGGPVPQRISDYGIEERLSRTDPADIHSWVFVWNGHAFLVVNTVDGAFAYDASTQQWAEFKSWGRTGWRAHLGCMVGPAVYAGDDTNGTIWTLSQTALLDGTDPIERISSAIIHQTGKSLPLSSVHCDISPGQTPYLSGQGANPTLELRLSRDGGKTYGGWRSAPIGKQGNYRARTFWTRLGMIDEPGLVMEFRTTDPAPWTLSGVRVNELAGGRSR
jgi:hypothetical protein